MNELLYGGKEMANISLFWDSINELIDVVERDQGHSNFQKLVNDIYNVIEHAYQCNLQIRCKVFNAASFLGLPPKQVSDPQPTSVSIVPFGHPEMEDSSTIDKGISIEYISMSVLELLKLTKQNHIRRIYFNPSGTFPSNYKTLFGEEDKARMYYHLTDRQIYIEFQMEWWSIPRLRKKVEAISSDLSTIAIGDLLTVNPEDGESFIVRVYEIRESILLCQRDTCDEYDNYLGVPSVYCLPGSSVVDNRIEICGV